jgi:hypothetical protein
MRGDELGRFIGQHFGAPFAALARAGVLGWILIAIWLMYPFAVQTVIHPGDTVGFQQWIQGFEVSRYLTSQALVAGEVTALIVLGALSLLQLGVVVLIYRRVQFAFSSWLVALLLIGVVANAIWWMRTGYFDLAGALAGLTPLVLVVGCEAACEKLGMDFVFGKGQRPHYEDII